jgi:hypothetical protein
MKLIPARESLVSDIPAGGGKNDNLFYSVVETVFAWLAAEFGIVSTKLLTHGRTINLTRKFAYGKILILS